MEAKHETLSRNHRFMFAQVCSTGLKSAQYGGRNSSRTLAFPARLFTSVFHWKQAVIQYHRRAFAQTRYQLGCKPIIKDHSRGGSVRATRDDYTVFA
jgi:hypothetical protein